ncbi:MULTISPECIES: circularly permuted type 2 ATP-grasp protein [unclassified Xanthobacter]|uniref:circularly permuted type 2 ATP-grasp protein n=1 Tax=unclassified Xanthobacter TaxID=2623496 RepID=UPI001EDD0862|nr:MULTISPECIES: circularly permuted type 2 ATP-grasp protein [unclassified Xanthobacter]
MAGLKGLFVSGAEQRSEAFERAAAESLLGGYRTLPGVRDEMMDAEGRPRPHWVSFLATLAEFGPEELGRRFSSADRYLRDSGVFYRVYDDAGGGERPWSLSHIPLLLEQRDWDVLSAGLIQRAELLETVLQDLYGPARLVSGGDLPAAAVAGSPEFLRPLVGVKPVGGRYLRLYAADVGRGPDGRWWVLADRTQAPSGSGYALENRLAMTRALPDVSRALHMQRVASFFQALRTSLKKLDRSGEGRIGMLTPGPMNETYFEHALLARYLGFLLVEGEDLTVRGDAVHVRTVAGLKRIDVLLRRLDADFADPLELNSGSRLGVPGLVQALRQGGLALANALGSGLVEAPALLAFLPRIATRILGAPLALPHVGTWWCGQDAERAQVMEHLDELVIGSAFGRRVPELPRGGSVLGADLGPAERRRLSTLLARRGVDLVGQDIARLSTTPVWTGERLTPRPFMLRVFLTATDKGWEVMPGGFCRISSTPDARAISLQKGDRSADVWVMTGGEVSDATLLPSPEHVKVRRSSGALPSRAADNLFWLGRYVERAEATLRLSRVLVGRLAETGDSGTSPLVSRLLGLLGAWGAMPRDLARATPARYAVAVLTRRDVPGALPQLVLAARAAASVIRDRFSPDAWKALVDLETCVLAPASSAVSEAEAHERADAALRIIAAFSGLASENMNRLTGWRFLELGRRTERAISTLRFARTFGEHGVPGSLSALLQVADSQITYRSRYVMIEARGPVLDLVLLDPDNPRSVAFQVERIAAHLRVLPGRDHDAPPPLWERLAARMQAELASATAESFEPAWFDEMEHILMQLSDEVAAHYFLQGHVPEMTMTLAM